MLVDDFLGGFVICVVDSPLTGYLFRLEDEFPPLVFLVAHFVVEELVPVSLGCLGSTKALVCLSR